MEGRRSTDTRVRSFEQKPSPEDINAQTVLERFRNSCRGGSLGRSLAAPASARIQCQGNFQVTKYGLLATPYWRSVKSRASPGAMARMSPTPKSATTR
jgi:hypothetical protein